MPRARQVVVGIDVGTTSVKAVVVDAGGREIASGSSDPIPTDISVPGGSEQDPEEIWQAVSAAVHRAREQVPGSAEVLALAVAAQSGSVVPIGQAGVASRAVTWMDARSRPLVDSWTRSALARIRAASGWVPSAGLGLATISWLLDTSEGVSDVQRWASVDDFLMHRLGAEWITNPSNAAGMQLMDVASLEWSDELCTLCGIEPALLSRIVPSGSDAGRVAPDAAEAMAISPTARLIIGGHDQACAALGLGAVEPGDIVLSAGTAWVLSIITGRVPVAEIPASYNLSPHVVPSRWSASRNLGGLGAAIAWCLESAGPAERLERDLMADGPHLAQPHFLPAIHDARRTDWGRFTGPSEPGAAVDRVRAVFEACAFEVRAATEHAPTSALATGQPIVFVGGGSRSVALAQTIADVLGRDLVAYPDASWPAFGAARLAADSQGWNAPLPTASDPTVVTHRPDRASIYEQRYQTHRQLETSDD